MPVIRVGETCVRCDADGLRPPRRVAAETAPADDPRRHLCVQHILLARVGGTVPTSTRGEP